MRVISIITGMLIGVPVLLLFWIGTQTFTRPTEHLLAVFMTLLAGALLASSILSTFKTAAWRVQPVLLGITAVALTILYLMLLRRHS